MLLPTLKGIALHSAHVRLSPRRPILASHSLPLRKKLLACLLQGVLTRIEAKADDFVAYAGFVAHNLAMLPYGSCEELAEQADFCQHALADRRIAIVLKVRLALWGIAGAVAAPRSAAKALIQLPELLIVLSLLRRTLRTGLAFPRLPWTSLLQTRGHIFSVRFKAARKAGSSVAVSCPLGPRADAVPPSSPPPSASAPVPPPPSSASAPVPRPAQRRKRRCY